MEKISNLNFPTVIFEKFTKNSLISSSNLLERERKWLITVHGSITVAILKICCIFLLLCFFGPLQSMLRFQYYPVLGHLPTTESLFRVIDGMQILGCCIG